MKGHPESGWTRIDRLRQTNGKQLEARAAAAQPRAASSSKQERCDGKGRHPEPPAIRSRTTSEQSARFPPSLLLHTGLRYPIGVRGNPLSDSQPPSVDRRITRARCSSDESSRIRGRDWDLRFLAFHRGG